MQKFENACPFDENARPLDAFECKVNSMLDLVCSGNQPVDIARARSPEPAGVLVGNVREAAFRQDFWCVPEQVADTAGVGIAAARAVMPSSNLDCFPARKVLEQSADKRRFAYIRRRSRHYHNRELHFGAWVRCTALRRNLLEARIPP